MQSFDKMNAYVNQISEQIRWKKARSRVEEELTNHLIDQRNAFIEQGFDEESATEKAISETGDAVIIGSQFDRTHRPKPQWNMLGIVGLLLVSGLLAQFLVFDTSYISTRLVYTVIGIAVMIATYLFDFTLLGKYPKFLFFTVILILCFTLYSQLPINGKNYYAEIVTLLFPMVFSAIVFATKNKRYGGIVLCGLVYLLLALFTLQIQSFSGFFIFSVSEIILLGVAMYKNWFNVNKLFGTFFMISPNILVAITLFMQKKDYIVSRITVALNPTLDPYGMGYWGIKVDKLLDSANLLGIENATDQYKIFTDMEGFLFRTDYFLIALTVRLGWIATIVIMGMILYFVVKGFIHCFKQKSGLGLFVSLAIMITFTLQVLIHVMFNMGIQIISPLSLPLVSYGNFSMVANMGLIGFMLSVFRTGDVVSDEQTLVRTSKIFSWQDKKLTIDFKAI